MADSGDREDQNRPPTRAMKARPDMGGVIDPSAVLREARTDEPKKVLEIDLHGCNIDRIASLEHFTAARELNLGMNNITVIENLTALRELRSLKLHSNQIATAAGLPPVLKHLTHLSLQDNALTSLGKELLALPQLKILRLDSNALTQLEHIPKSLSVLNVSYNRLTSLRGLTGMKYLEELTAAGNNVRRLDGLHSLQRLEQLDMGGNPLEHLEGLKQLANLRILYVAGCGLATLKGLPPLPELRELDASRNNLANVRPLARRLPGLDLLDISNNAIPEIEVLLEALKPLAGLMELSFRGNPCCPVPNASTADGNHGDGTSTVAVAVAAAEQRIRTELPQIEFLNGRTLFAPSPQRPTTAGGSVRPPMKAMTMEQFASAGVSVVGIADEMDIIAQRLKQQQTLLEQRFASLRLQMDGLTEAEADDKETSKSQATPSQPIVAAAAAAAAAATTTTAIETDAQAIVDSRNFGEEGIDLPPPGASDIDGGAGTLDENL